ncbi:MAG: hypothetical protein GXX96_04015 [Planctomycetaceae bacterium]|nr:hypothetical protein [Planctomycetaceae bacterium]
MAFTGAEKWQRWRQRHPDRYRATLEKRRAKRGHLGSRKYRCGRRAGWGVYILFDGDRPVGAVAAHCGTTALLGFEARLFLDGIPRKLACKLAVQESRRLGVRLCGIHWLARRIAAGAV